MTCTCRGKTAFQWAECNCPSIFGTDESYTRAAKTGQTMSQIATQSVTKYEAKNGRSLGTISQISEKADRATAQRNDQRRLQRQRRAGHYAKKAA